MKGETHKAGALALRDTLRLPLSILYLVVRPNLGETLLYYALYDTITMKPAKIGAVLPDYDQASWKYSPNELYEPVGKKFYKLLKRTKATHRSTHTHNLDLWTLLLGVPSLILYGLYLSRHNPIYMVAGTCVFILYTSILSHQFLDTLTYQGTFQSHLKTKIKGSPKDRQRLSVVPINKSFYDMKPVYFGRWKTWFFKPVRTTTGDAEWGRTGGVWEESILYKLAVYLDNRMNLKTYIIEIIVIYLLIQVLI